MEKAQTAVREVYGDRFKKARDIELNKRATALSKEIGDVAEAYEKIRGAVETLRTDSANPEASQLVGEFYCLVKGEWERGMALLAVGDHPTYSPLALRELKEHPTPEEQMALGADWLAIQGPTPGNFYCNYYANQVMFQLGGPRWEKWNTKMRDLLVGSQSGAGHERGSWSGGNGDHGTALAGRVYSTALGALILETYYRHPRLYQQGNTPHAEPAPGVTVHGGDQGGRHVFSADR